MKIRQTFIALAVTAAALTAAPVLQAAEAPVAAPAAQTVKAGKPTVWILATGGTIAGVAASATEMTGYKAGSLGIDTLLAAVPQIHDIADCRGEQIANVASPNIKVDTWLKLAGRINELLAKPEVNGVVITHGTDTLEETAWFLNLVVKSDKPVVIVGAMRPATAISADGPVNLLNAVKLASTPEAKGRGVMIAMNDVINGARDVQKTNTLRVDTFQSPELGYLGYFEAGNPVFYRASTRKHTSQTEFDVTGLKDLPPVVILYSHVADDGTLAKAAVAAGVKGIVHAGTGNGSVPDDVFKVLKGAVEQGITVVRGARVPNGPTIRSVAYFEEAGLLKAGTLNPQKARILLQLALTKTSDPKEIQRMFDEY